MTDSSGMWSFSGLFGIITVTPVSEHFSFEPASITFDHGGRGFEFTATTTAFDGEVGSESAPYEIATAEQLDKVRFFLDKHFILVNDLDLDGWNWNPIGVYRGKFTGSFDGGGHTIKNLTSEIADLQATPHVGLFGYIDNAVVKNLHLENVDIPDGSFVGALIGTADNSVVENCTVTGTVSGESWIGGLVGSANASVVRFCSAEVQVRGVRRAGGLIGYGQYLQIERCHAQGTVDARDYAGGLLGYLEYGEVEYCYADVETTSSINVGGLIGRLEESTVMKCYAAGYVIRTYSSHGLRGGGGLVGYAVDSIIMDCFAKGAVNGADGVGGLVGRLSQSSRAAIIMRTYAVGRVSGSSDTGGLVGYIGFGSPEITDSFYDRYTTNQSDTGKGIPMTTAEMMDGDIYYYWDLAWEIPDGESYPYLKTLPNPYQ